MAKRQGSTLLNWSLAVVLASAILGGLLVIGWGAQQHRSQESAPAAASPAVRTEVVATGTLTDQASITALTTASAVESVRVPQVPEARFTANGLKAGTEAELGKVLAEVNERPVIVLQGEIAAYRTLSRGAFGDDVTQLQASLATLGYEVGKTPGTYDEGTARGVTALFRSLGYPAVTEDGIPIPDSKPGKDAALRLGEGYFAQAVPVKALSTCGATRQLVPASLCQVTTAPLSPVAQIPAALAKRLKGGERVVVSLPNGKKHEGMIGAAVKTSGKTSTGVSQHALMLNSSPALPLPSAPAMKAMVIFKQSSPGAVVIPDDAVQKSGKKNWVRKADGSTVPVTVELCLQHKCAVTGALKAKDVLILSDPAS